MKKIAFFLMSAIVLLASCDSGKILPNPSGTAYEVLVVINESDWKTSCGKAIFDLLNEDMLGLPQSEPMFKMSRVSHAGFDNLLKPARNIIIVNISQKYTQTKITYLKDYWAKTQAIVMLNSPSTDSLAALVVREKTEIQNFFIKKERQRTLQYLTTTHNKKASDEIYHQFGVRLLIPADMKLSKTADNFYWITNDNAKIRRDIVVYSYPYVDVENFSKEQLLQKRDSILKKNIPGPEDGSYMGTERKYHYPDMRSISINGDYCAEIRGLWKVFDGSIMGGPFVSHSRLDELHERIVTVEGFVFAPGTDKRNPLRQLESVLYSLKMPQELEEIIITNQNK